MKQVFFRKGEIIIEDVPAPVIKRNRLIIETKYSAISTGTEVSSITKSGFSLLTKAKNQPEKVKKALDLVGKLGLKNAITVINNTLSELSPIGYSLAGIVKDLDKENVQDFKIGDRVACAGNQYAFHSEIVSVPKNLAVKIPENVTLAEASTVAIGSIALQGIRRLNPTIGETIVVIGLGVIGQITVQILNANGCRVIGLDLDKSKVDFAKKMGLVYSFEAKNEINDIVLSLTNGYGADGVIITAGSNSNEIISQAFNFCRKKGRVVLVGDVGLNIKREDIYKKELDFLVSTSYGPGRYDESYEEKGIDYPVGYVRWTEKRNMEAYLSLIENRKIDISELITKIFNFEEAVSAYEEIRNRKDYLLCLFKYRDNVEISHKIENPSYKPIKDRRIKVGFIGLGGFAKSVHLPNLLRLSDFYDIFAVASQDSVNAKNTGEFYKARIITTDYRNILENEEIDLVFICTRHSNHADLLLKGLSNNKHIFVEKPLATSYEDLKRIEEYYSSSDNSYRKIFMVGFNRRFSPLISRVKNEVDRRVSPLFLNYNINAGYVDKNSWMHEDGGRIVGELCHFIDLAVFLVNSQVDKFIYDFCDFREDSKFIFRDNVSLILRFKDGSVANINYYSLGNKNMPKERIELNFDNRSIVLDDFKEISSYGLDLRYKSKIANKGHYEELECLYKSLRDGLWPISFEEMLEVTKITLKINEG